MNILDNLKNNFFYMKLIYKFSKSYIIAQAVIALINGLLPLASIVIPKLIIDELLKKNDFHIIINYIVIYLIIHLIASSTVLFLQEKYVNVNGNLYIMHFLMLINKKIATLDMAQIDMSETHQKIGLANDTINKGIGVSLVNGFFNALTSVFLIVSTTVIISAADIKLSMVIILFALLTTFLNIKIENWHISQRDDTIYLIRLLNYFIRIIGDKDNAKEIRIYDLLNLTMIKFNNTINKLKDRLHMIYSWTLKIKIISLVVEGIKSNGILLYLAYLTFKNQISIGGFTQYFTATNQLSNAILSFVGFFTHLNINGKYIESFKQFMEMKGTIDKENYENTYRHDVLRFSNNIRFEDVTFSYTGSKFNILESVNYTFEYGKFYAIVGENGTGKTTIANLISRLYDPTEGKIYLNNIPINEIDYKEYRSNISSVIQNFKLFAFTIAENVTIDAYEKKGVYNTDKIYSCLTKAGLYEKVKTFPNGIYSSLEKLFHDDGIILSGGESQKLAIARALYKEDANIIIMDEPSSALDPISEDEMLRNLKNIFSNKMIIYISHRLTCASYADEILYIKNNRIYASGSHNELLSKNKEYEMFYNSQAKHYELKRNPNCV